MSNTDHRLALGYGSAWHLLRYLGYHREKLNAAVEAAIGDSAKVTRWLDFDRCRTASRYCTGKPVRDAEWTRLNFIEDESLQRKYDEFWPPRGSQQNWDAVGEGLFAGDREYLLVEAKGHLDELRRTGQRRKAVGEPRSYQHLMRPRE